MALSSSKLPRARISTWSRGRKLIVAAAVLTLSIAIFLAIGLGVGLRSQSSGPSSSLPANSSSPSNSTTIFNGWKPVVGTSWQIVLEYALNDITADVEVYDIDLFTNSASTIAELHSRGRKVICYFSAGSYEPNRPDSGDFRSTDLGEELEGWPGEIWLNTNSNNVRSIMDKRLDLAVSKNCDGVDPDNVDAYVGSTSLICLLSIDSKNAATNTSQDNSNGVSLSKSDAVSYVTFLSTAAHSRNLSIGLKNGGDIVSSVINLVQWEVNEQCVQYQECDVFRPFIDANKPVFHIEYPPSAPTVTSQQNATFCGDLDASGFSTVLKNADLDDWIAMC